LSHRSFTNKLREIWAKYPLHLQKIARNLSVFFGGSECVNGAILSKELFVCADKRKGYVYTNWNMSRPITREREAPPGKICWTCFKAIGHSLKKIFTLSQNSSPPLVSQAGYGPEYEPCLYTAKMTANYISSVKGVLRQESSEISE